MREITFLIILLLAQAVKAQTISVLHTFSGGPDGGNSYAGLTIRAGNLLGTTWAGGDGYGTVFQLKALRIELEGW